jgi:hypothetical protein
MNPSRDPFGFPATSRRPQGQGTSPIVVVAQPGQEVRIVVPDDGGMAGTGGGRGDSSASPKPSTDSSASPKPSTDSSASPKPSTDSSASPKPNTDAGSQDPFGFRAFRRGFSPTPVTIVARSGQEIRIVVPDESGSVPGLAQRFSGDSSASPKPSVDQR